MRLFFTSLVYLMFFFSGSSALIYQVVWVRSLSLVFGGTHLAVTTVLSIFMGGLALGSYLIGRHVDAIKKPLRLYGFLELGIALSAALFMLLLKIYPAAYIFLAQGREFSPLYLTGIRVIFAFIALIIPTTLMGGTLPVLSRFTSQHSSQLGKRLSLLYGFNTLGAVFGTAAAGFFLLRFYSVTFALSVALLINIVIGLISIVLDAKSSSGHTMLAAKAALDNTARQSAVSGADHDVMPLLPLILWGIGLSGFCALGYEVLWTRILTLTVGTSVYGFTIMLIAFLTGIAFGSKSYGLLRQLPGLRLKNTRGLFFVFSVIQIMIGLMALLVTYFIRELPITSLFLRDYFSGMGAESFMARQWANLILAFAYMFAPAFLMGLAFPVAGKLNMLRESKIGQAVGEVLAYNTVGAILGSAASGFFLIYVLGIERSLLILCALNVGGGLLLMASLSRKKSLHLAMTGMVLATLTAIILAPDTARMWDVKFFAIFRNNQAETFDTPERRKDAIANTNVLFYHEGINSTISVIQPNGGRQAVLVNGKVVASTSLRDRQCQLTLGHLPMLLHTNPEDVLVVGLGTGMTLGATSIHPELKNLTLAEIEPHVVGAARTFGEYNHQVLDNPKLKIVFNDGRNFLMTTDQKYDVITADPIHPWTQGSGYLYTTEYFKLAADHLKPGGIMCQWLPIYELSVDDLKSVARTFSQNFKYTMAWLTHYDAEIIGSNDPIIIDEEALVRRLDVPTVNKALAPVMMASAQDFLSYFILGTTGMQAFAEGGVINSDDNLYLEFSTPLSMGKNLMGGNATALAKHRENILPYLVPAQGELAGQGQEEKWSANLKAAQHSDRAHALLLGGQVNGAEFQKMRAELEEKYSWFSPARFVVAEYEKRVELPEPTLLDMMRLVFHGEKNQNEMLEISAVIARVSSDRAALVFVNNAAREIFGQKYFSGPDLDAAMAAFNEEVMTGIQNMYAQESVTAHAQGRNLPPLLSSITKIKHIIAEKCAVGHTS